MASSVDSIYQTVRAMAAAFEFKPEQRINESELSKNLGISRTPLREALNRLVAEGLLTAQEGRGFFLPFARTDASCRALRITTGDRGRDNVACH